MPRRTPSALIGSCGSAALESSTQVSTSPSPMRLVAGSGKAVGELAGESAGVALRGSHDQAGVVAGERADDPVVRDTVEGARDRRGGTELRLDDDDVPRGGHAAAELTQDRAQRLTRIWVPAPLGQRVARPAERVVG